MGRITLHPFGEVRAHQLLETPAIPAELVLGQYPGGLDAACKVIATLLARQRRQSARLVVLLTDDLRIVAGGATAPGMAALLKRFGSRNHVGRYTHDCDIAHIRDDIEGTAQLICGAHP